MESNCKSKFNLDHVYCHPNESYIRANPNATDILALLKENKQLKAMLLLHLDLIQEQSDQLMAKDKLLSSLRGENETLKSRLDKVERRLHIKYETNPKSSSVSSQIDIKQEPTPVVVCTQSSVSPVDGVNPKEITENTIENKYKICDENNYSTDKIIGESNGKFISKIVLHRVQSSEIASSVSVKEETSLEMIKEEERQFEAIKDIKTSSEAHVQNDTEDSFSCGSVEQDQVISRKRKRYGVITTKIPYATREWEDQNVDDEANNEEAEALKSDEPNLEIPKWTIKEFTGLYSIEGTEDLSDEMFLKRHAKLEYDEKRRKKWDVQRIREQRTIERLKRRHCKPEIQDSENNQEIRSFYPTADSIKFIHITADLPVQAFGDGIPRILPKEFGSVLELIRASPTEVCETLVSSLAFLKKRRRPLSQSISSHARRMCRRQVKF